MTVRNYYTRHAFASPYRIKREKALVSQASQRVGMPFCVGGSCYSVGNLVPPDKILDGHPCPCLLLISHVYSCALQSLYCIWELRMPSFQGIAGMDLQSELYRHLLN